MQASPSKTTHNDHHNNGGYHLFYIYCEPGTGSITDDVSSSRWLSGVNSINAHFTHRKLRPSEVKQTLSDRLATEWQNQGSRAYSITRSVGRDHLL